MNDKIGEYDAEWICYQYWRHFYLTTKGFSIRRMKNFDKQREDVQKWACFEHLSLIANKHRINLHDYIPMIAKKCLDSGNYFHPKSLINPANLQIWNEKRRNARNTEGQQKIVKSFVKSLTFLVSFCVKNNIENFNDYLNATIRNDQLNTHIVSEKLSKYLMSLLPEVTLIKIKQYLDPDVAHQFNEMVIKNKDALCSNTLTSLRELTGTEVSTTNTIVDIINRNITKNMKKAG